MSASSSSPSVLVRAALEGKRKLEADIAAVERQLYELEGHVLAEPFNVVTGFAGFHKGPAINATRPVLPEERIFSLSSLTSPVGAMPWPAAPAEVARALTASVAADVAASSNK